MNRRASTFGSLLAVGLLLAGFTASCTTRSQSKEDTVTIDGSSTVFPISQAVAEEFMKAGGGVQVTVGTSGTGGGFEKFARGEIDISDASRPITESEKKACRVNGVEWIELKVAIDGLTVVVHPSNDFVDCLTVAELKKIWESGSPVKTWNDVRERFPDAEIKLFGPDTKSGTFDYFTEEICGRKGNSHSNYTRSADDNVLVTGVANERNALGYFGYAYYVENRDKLKAVGISPTDSLGDCVKPTRKTVKTGEYKPLSRPLFLYVRKEALKKPHVVEFLRYYLEDEGQELVAGVGYVRLDEEQIETARSRLEDAIREVQGGEVNQ